MTLVRQVTFNSLSFNKQGGGNTLTAMICEPHKYDIPPYWDSYTPGRADMADTWIWVPLTLMAAAMQTARTAGQKRLTKDVSLLMATLTRFLFGLPFAVLYLALLLWSGGRLLPPVGTEFLLFSLLTALSQISGTFLLIYVFSIRNFAVGTTYARTETLTTAIVGAALFGEAIPLSGWVAIAVCIAGVVLMTASRAGIAGESLLTQLRSSAAGVGLASGLGFAIASLSLRRASLSLGDPDYLVSAAFTLVAVIAIETLLLGSYVAVREREQYGLVRRRLGLSSFVGLTSMLGSVGWFTAMTLERASYVKALGQVELILGLVVSTVFFRERYTWRELAGIALIAAGVLLLLFYA
jgi:drug/metabolite transporter (DMT)-like permease